MKELRRIISYMLQMLSLVFYGQLVFSYSVTLPNQYVPMIYIAQDKIHHVTSETSNDHQEEKSKLRVKYDLGAKRNMPVRPSNSPYEMASLPFDDKHDITKYLVEHQVERPMMSHDDWIRFIDRQREQQPVKVPSSKKLPSIQLSRFTDDSVVKICHHHPDIVLGDSYSDNYQLHAYSQRSLRQHFDLNTPWIDMLIYEQQQKLKTTETMLQKHLVAV
jgi:hypothetical protein